MRAHVCRRPNRDQCGASLVLAIVFLVVIGALAMATLAMVTSGLNNRQSLDSLRDREYAADAAIEFSIAQVRALPAPGPARLLCGPYQYNLGATNVPIHVDCTPVPTQTFSGFLQRNVIFAACVTSDASATCGAAGGPPIVIRAQINFQAVGAGSIVVVTRTWVQSWSVNR